MNSARHVGLCKRRELRASKEGAGDEETREGRKARGQIEEGAGEGARCDLGGKRWDQYHVSFRGTMETGKCKECAEGTSAEMLRDRRRDAREHRGT